ncbi:MAG: tryptophan 7-halogenase [Synechococcaceae cyanobacterium]|nr:tryptophan 7-halogenase [Synechococcaceae cyanobacterium]
MHVCIVGTGAAGWITCLWLAQNPLISRLTIVGSAAIPTIGVGESTTLHFHRFLEKILPDAGERWRRLAEMDAAIKYGVSYEGWSRRRFLHAFVGCRSNNLDGYLLGRKPVEEDANAYMMPLHEAIYQNLVCPDPDVQAYSFHVDAKAMIGCLERLAAGNPRIHHKRTTIVASDYENDQLLRLRSEDDEWLSADFFVSCIGQRAFNHTIFKQTYEDYSNVLLTDKAFFMPIEYEDQRRQFHPYTVARSMPHGWRWITPTRSRIGSGYAFSSRHVSLEAARDDFLADVGDPNAEPRLVDFTPRKATATFQGNTATLGMASGFLEPLDAPGLNLLLHNLQQLDDLLETIQTRTDEIAAHQSALNRNASETFDFWAAFILHQYKLSTRDDTPFWRDHRTVQFQPYDQILDNLWNVELSQSSSVGEPRKVNFMSRHQMTPYEPCMFYNTTAGRDIQWPVSINLPLQKHHRPASTPLIHHLDFLARTRAAPAPCPARPLSAPPATCGSAG